MKQIICGLMRCSGNFWLVFYAHVRHCGYVVKSFWDFKAFKFPFKSRQTQKVLKVSIILLSKDVLENSLKILSPFVVISSQNSLNFWNKKTRNIFQTTKWKKENYDNKKLNNELKEKTITERKLHWKLNPLKEKIFVCFLGKNLN